MRRYDALLLGLFLLASPALPGCSREGPAPVAPPLQGIKIAKPAPGGQPGGEAVKAPDPALDPAAQQKYDAALQDAFRLLAERHYPDALAALEAARTFKDSEFLRGEIDKLKVRIDQLAAAEKTVEDIRTVLDEGKPAEAAQLASAALLQYGGTDAAPRLIKLKLQADALTAAQVAEKADRYKRFRAEGEAALKEKNLRAAALAFEQALQGAEDAALRKQYEDLQATLKRYDDCRNRAAELRRDPTTLEDAIAQLKQAALAWDTLQVRQDLDECTLALQNRRDRVGVAEFEVRGEVGLPAAGRTLAEELLPHLKPKFDLVEWTRLARVVDELKLDPARLALSEADQRELGRLTKVRYLVLGSVSLLGGLTIEARLVDVRTGLIVQTAKVVVPDPEQAVAQMPELARRLLLTDEQRLAEEQKDVAAAPPPDGPLPPPPDVPGAGQPPPAPIVLDTAQPPPLGGVAMKDFQGLPPPPAAGVQPVLIVGAEDLIKRRLLLLSVEVGDNLFRRGRFRAAFRHYEFALSLAPGNIDILVRLDRCRPFLPPPLVVVGEPPPARPRVAVVDFFVSGDPAVVPPALRRWTPQELAPYFSPPFEVVERGEVLWYMRRLGLTLRDLMTDPAARRWLGRALNVRYFVLGTIQQTASFDVTVYLLDAEYGFLQGSARVHVRNPFELRFRLRELAALTLMTPDERLAYEQQAAPFDGLLVQARECSGRGQFELAIGFFRKALKRRPANVVVLVQLEDADRQARRAAWEQARRRDAIRMRREALEWQERQRELAHQAELARIRAAEAAAALSAEQRRLGEQQRLRDLQNAHDQLILQAQVAFKRGDFQVSVRLFEGAAGLRPSKAAFREMAQARAELERLNRERAAGEQALRDLRQRRQLEEDAAKARRQLKDERQRNLAEERARWRAQEERDQAAYQRLVEDGQRQLKAAKFDAAIATLQSARSLKKTPAVEGLLDQALVGQARAQATAQGEQARRELEQRLAAEQERRRKADAEAKRNQDLYQAALQQAQKALAAKKYDTAIARYQEAGKVFRTDAVLTGLSAAQAGRGKAELELKAKSAEPQKAAEVKRLVTSGQAALAAGEHDKAVKAFTEARQLAPGNLDALAGLSKAEQARERGAADARRRDEEKQRLAAYRRLLESGQANLANKRYEAAVLALNEALKLKPGDPAALQARDQAEKARQQAAGSAKTAEADRQKAAAYQKAMSDGRLALTGRQFDAAIKAFSEAQKLQPGDHASAGFLKDAQKAKADLESARAADARRRAEEAQRAASVQKALGDGRSALAAGNLKGAAEAFAAAGKLAPKDAAVLAALEDLRKAQQAQQAEASARQKRQEQYQAFLTTGRAALAAKRYEEAEKAFAQAAGLVPGDRTSQDLLQQAQKARAEAQAAALKQKQADQQLAAQVQQHLDTGRAALKAGKLDAAAQSFAAAEKLAPKDAGVGAALRELAQARQSGAALEKAKAAYQQALNTGQQALNGKRYEEAIKAFSEALRLVPGDANATRLQKQAQAAAQEARLAQEAEAKKKAEEQKRLVEFNRLVALGQAAQAGKRHADAVRAFGDALKLRPGDATASKLLREAQAQEAASRTPPPAQAEYTKRMQLGAALEKQQKHADAVKAYQEALKFVPGDAQANEGYRRAKYAQHMGEGQRQLTARRFTEAVREFEAALQVRPGDPAATEALKRAKAGK
jgi:tetratricopeptide (TPR) repeat protein